MGLWDADDMYPECCCGPPLSLSIGIVPISSKILFFDLNFYDTNKQRGEVKSEIVKPPSSARNSINVMITTIYF